MRPRQRVGREIASCIRGIDVHVETDAAKSFGAIKLLKILQFFGFFLAEFAPGGPAVEDHRFALEAC